MRSTSECLKRCRAATLSCPCPCSTGLPGGRRVRTRSSACASFASGGCSACSAAPSTVSAPTTATSACTPPRSCSLAEWRDRALFLALRWGCGRLLVGCFLLLHFCVRALAPLVLLVPKCSETTGTLAPSLAVAATAVVDYALFSATASYLVSWSGALALLAFVKIDKAVLRRSLQVVGGGWLTALDARVRGTASRLRFRYAGPALAFLQVFWLLLFVVWPRSAGALEAAREDARAAAGLLALALLLTSLDREDVDLEGLLELVKMWRDRSWQKSLKKQL